MHALTHVRRPTPWMTIVIVEPALPSVGAPLHFAHLKEVGTNHRTAVSVRSVPVTSAAILAPLPNTSHPLNHDQDTVVGLGVPQNLGLKLRMKALFNFSAVKSQLILRQL